MPDLESGWQVEPRPTPDALKPGFRSDPYTVPELLHERDHITDWASFGELAGPEGMKLLWGAASIGEPDASVH